MKRRPAGGGDAVYRHDQTFAADTKSAVERELRALPPAPGPDSRFRAELRLQLMAAVERGPSEMVVPQRPRRRLQFGHRAVAAMATAVAVLLVITGTTWWLAQRALPGDALYGIKRAGESADLSTKQGDQSRGQAYLSLSTTRIDEAVALVKRDTASAGPGIEQSNSGVGTAAANETILSASGSLSTRIDHLVRGALVDGDTSAVTATRLLTTASVSTRATTPITSVAGWLVSQRAQVHTLVALLPETGAATAGGQARVLQRDLTAIQVRVRRLSANLGCSTCTFAKHDRLGPLPCQVCPPAPAATATRTATPGATSSGASTSGAATSSSPSVPTALPSTTAPLGVPTVPGTGAAGTTGVPPTGLPPTGLPTTGLPTAVPPPTGLPTTVSPVGPPSTTPAPTPAPTPPAPTSSDPTSPSPTVAPTTTADPPTTDQVPSDVPSEDSTDDTGTPSVLPTCLPPLCISGS